MRSSQDRDGPGHQLESAKQTRDAAADDYHVMCAVGHRWRRRPGLRFDHSLDWPPSLRGRRRVDNDLFLEIDELSRIFGSVMRFMWGTRFMAHELDVGQFACTLSAIEHS